MRTSKSFVRIIAFVFALAVSLSGCSGEKNNVSIMQSSPTYVENEDYQNFLPYYFPVAKAANGYYFFNGLRLYFFDAETKETYPVCSKPNCDHTAASCTAYFNLFQYYPFMLSYYENALYVWGWETSGNTRHNYIYEISLDNYKRKKSTFLFDSTSSVSIYYMIHRGYVYYIKDSGTELKEKTACLYRVKIGETNTKREEEVIYEFSGIGAEFWGLTASGNYLFVLNSSYGDTEGNNYKTSYNSINIHSLQAKELVGNKAYSLFADSEYAYYEKDENTVNRINLNTNEETFFCKIDGPAYISTDSNYIYFDNLQAVHIDKVSQENRKILVYDKNGNYITEIVPKNPEDDCYFGGDDIMIFKEVIPGETVTDVSGKNALKGYYVLDKSQLTSSEKQFINME